MTCPRSSERSPNPALHVQLHEHGGTYPSIGAVLASRYPRAGIVASEDWHAHVQGGLLVAPMMYRRIVRTKGGCLHLQSRPVLPMPCTCRSVCHPDPDGAAATTRLQEIAQILSGVQEPSQRVQCSRPCQRWNRDERCCKQLHPMQRMHPHLLL